MLSYHNQGLSLETWSRSPDLFLQVSVSVSKVSGLVSVATSLKTLNIAKKWYGKFL